MTVHDAELVTTGGEGARSKALARRPKGGNLLAKKGAINFEKLLSTALESGATIDAMERVLAMRRELKAEAAEEAFSDALNRFQSLCPVIHKTKAVKNSAAKGGGVRYSYAPLEHIIKTVKPYLKKCGFSYRLTARLSEDARRFIVVMELRHVAGHMEVSEFPMPIEGSDFMNLLQSFGSSNSYAKRYVFTNALGIMCGDTDDDGASAGPVGKAREEARSEPRERARPQSRDTGASAPAKRCFTPGPAERIGQSTEKTIREMMRRGAISDSDLHKRFNIMSVADIPAKEVQLVLDWIKSPDTK